MLCKISVSEGCFIGDDISGQDVCRGELVFVVGTDFDNSPGEPYPFVINFLYDKRLCKATLASEYYYWKFFTPVNGEHKCCEN